MKRLFLGAPASSSQVTSKLGLELLPYSDVTLLFGIIQLPLPPLMMPNLPVVLNTRLLGELGMSYGY